MKTKQSKWAAMEPFASGPGTRFSVWERNPSVISWESFKKVTAGLRADGFIKVVDSTCRLTVKGHAALERWYAEPF